MGNGLVCVAVMTSYLSCLLLAPRLTSSHVVHAADSWSATCARANVVAARGIRFTMVPGWVFPFRD
jgi:hypothetical protein